MYILYVISIYFINTLHIFYKKGGAHLPSFPYQEKGKGTIPFSKGKGQSPFPSLPGKGGGHHPPF